MERGRITIDLFISDFVEADASLPYKLFLKILFEAPDTMNFSALPYTPGELEEASHAYELPRYLRTVVRCSLNQMGIAGDDSWGSKTHPEFLIPSDKKLVFTMSFKGF